MQVQPKHSLRWQHAKGARCIVGPFSAGQSPPSLPRIAHVFTSITTFAIQPPPLPTVASCLKLVGVLETKSAAKEFGRRGKNDRNAAVGLHTGAAGGRCRTGPLAATSAAASRRCIDARTGPGMGEARPRRTACDPAVRLPCQVRVFLPCAFSFPHQGRMRGVAGTPLACSHRPRGLAPPPTAWSDPSYVLICL